MLAAVAAFCGCAHQYDIVSRCVQGRGATACAAYNRRTGKLTVESIDERRCPTKRGEQQ